MLQRMIYRRTILLACLGLAGLCLRVQALSVTPGRTQITLMPGQKLKGSFTVLNETDAPTWVEITQKDWFVLPENKAYTVEDWLRVQGKERFRLKPGQSRTVPYKVSCPDKAVGELVGMVSFSAVGDDPSMVVPMLSVSVYASVAGTEKMTGEIKEIGLRRWQDNFQLVCLLHASGNVHLRPEGVFKIFDSQGNEVAAVPVKSGDPTYPGMDRGYFGNPSDLVLKPGRYALTVDLTYKTLTLTSRREFVIDKDGSIHMAERS